MPPLFSPLVERALRIAAHHHRRQVRKQSDVPYLTHPAGVALILARAGFTDETILAAALLHDVVEDTDYTADQLAAEFPPQVTEYVTALTEQKLDEAGTGRPWQVRKQEHIARIAAAPLAARAVALADKLHNLGTMLYDLDRGEDVWQRFNAPPDKVVWYHGSMIAAAEQHDPELKHLAGCCRNVLERLAGATT